MQKVFPCHDVLMHENIKKKRIMIRRKYTAGHRHTER